jgi:hypothetical protein
VSDTRRDQVLLHSSSPQAAPRLVPSRLGVAAWIFAFTAGGCADSTGDDGQAGDDSSETQTPGDTGTETGESPDQAPELAAEPEIVHHPKQPMVVDVLVTLDRPGLIELVHDTDPGVRVVSLTPSDTSEQHHLRVRGLAPASAHDLTLTLIDPTDSAARADHPLAFTTNGVQPGFRPDFEVEVGDPAAVDPSYRMFDYAYTPLVDPTGIFVVDPQGITRWYYSTTPMYPGVPAVWAGISLLDDGTVLSLRDGGVTIIDELGEQQLWLPSEDHGLPLYHHDVIKLQNGNYLALSNSFERIDYSAITGDDNQLVAGDLLVELAPTGEIVWTWDTFDHLDPLRIRSAHGDGLDYYDRESGEYGFDWTHGNGVIERAEDGLLLLSLRHQNWLVAIDHATGEVVWRLGAEGDLDLLDGTWFFHQHSPQWQPDGSLLLYDNANGNPDVPSSMAHSRAVRYEVDESAMTATQVWDSRQDPHYLSPVAGDADRTPSGHVLMLDSALQSDPSMFDLGKNYSRLVELPSDGEPTPLWSLTTKVGSFVYRATTIEQLPGAVF